MNNAAATAKPAPQPRRVIAHVIFRFDVGGLENGVVNLVNALPADEFEHAIVALTEASSFQNRLRGGNVTVHELHKRPGKDLGAYVRLFRLLRRLRPDIVHTRNFGTLDCTLVAWLAGVRVCIHGEHGWDIHDPDGTRTRYRLVRQALSPLIRRFVAVSRDLERWLVETVRISPTRVQRICNGVDTERFRPAARAERGDFPAERFPDGCVIVGSVTRFEPIKDPLNLVRAFIDARRQVGPGGVDLRLMMLGDGPLRGAALRLLEEAGEASAAWLPGAREDVARFLPGVSVYALGSLREGISNTVLEAMAAGVPVVASATGGNLELIEPGVTGVLVRPGDPVALASALVAYAIDGPKRAAHGRMARLRAEREYSLQKMVADYRSLYRAASAGTGVAA